MSNHRRRNQLSETTGKLAASPAIRRSMVTRELLSSGGRVPRRDPVDNARPPTTSSRVRMNAGGQVSAPGGRELDSDSTSAFVRALLGR